MLRAIIKFAQLSGSGFADTPITGGPLLAQHALGSSLALTLRTTAHAFYAQQGVGLSLVHCIMTPTRLAGQLVKALLIFQATKT